VNPHDHTTNHPHNCPYDHPHSHPHPHNHSNYNNNYYNYNYNNMTNNNKMGVSNLKETRKRQLPDYLETVCLYNNNNNNNMNGVQGPSCGLELTPTL
jgi:hypothetical protein